MRQRGTRRQYRSKHRRIQNAEDLTDIFRLQYERDNLQNELKATFALLSTAESEVVTKSTWIRSVEAALDDSRHTLSDRDNAVNDLKKSEEALRAQLAQAPGRDLDLEAQMSEKEKIMGEIRIKVEEMEKKASTLEKKLLIWLDDFRGRKTWPQPRTRKQKHYGERQLRGKRRWSQRHSR